MNMQQFGRGAVAAGMLATLAAFPALALAAVHGPSPFSGGEA